MTINLGQARAEPRDNVEQIALAQVAALMEPEEPVGGFDSALGHLSPRPPGERVKDNRPAQLARSVVARERERRKHRLPCRAQARPSALRAQIERELSD